MPANLGTPRGREGAGALSLARVDACAEELRLMGLERDDVPTEVDRVVRAEGSFSRKSSRAYRPATRYVADVKGFLVGRRELDDAFCGEWRKSKGSSVFLSGPLNGHEGE